MEVTNEQVINRLVESEHGKKIAADIMREQHMARIALAASIVKLKAERGEIGRELTDEKEATEQRLKAARKALTEAENDHRQAVMKQKQTAAHYSARLQRLEAELRNTAPPAIDDFLSWLSDQEEVVTATEITQRANKTDRISTHSDTAVREVWTNAESLRQRLQAIRAARQEAQALKARVMDTADLQQRLDELKAGLPTEEMRLAYER